MDCTETRGLRRLAIDWRPAGARMPRHGVEKGCIDGVAEVGHSEQGGFKVAAVMRHEESDDVFEHDQRRAAVAEVVEDASEAEEGAGLFAVESGHCSGDGEVVAGEGGGEEVAGGDVVGVEFVDVAEVEVVEGEIGGVHFLFVGVDVVGEDDAPVLAFESEADEADAGEELGGGELPRKTVLAGLRGVLQQRGHSGYDLSTA